MSDDSQRLALLTGGSRGLGRALAGQLRAEGWRVIELSRSASTAGSVAVDLSRPDTVADAIRTALAGVDAQSVRELLLLSNAGTVEPLGPAAHQPADAIITSLNTNLLSATVFFATAIAHFQACPGRKVAAQITSGAALRAHAGLSLYSAAKAGMEQFMRVLAVEQAREVHPFIAVNVDPGALDTDMQAVLRSASSEDYPGAAAFAQRHRDGALGQVERVAATVLRLLAAPDLAGGTRLDAQARP